MQDGQYSSGNVFDNWRFWLVGCWHGRFFGYWDQRRAATERRHSCSIGSCRTASTRVVTCSAQRAGPSSALATTTRMARATCCCRTAVRLSIGSSKMGSTNRATCSQPALGGGPLHTTRKPRATKSDFSSVTNRAWPGLGRLCPPPSRSSPPVSAHSVCSAGAGSERLLVRGLSTAPAAISDSSVRPLPARFNPDPAPCPFGRGGCRVELAKPNKVASTSSALQKQPGPEPNLPLNSAPRNRAVSSTDCRSHSTARLCAGHARSNLPRGNP